EGVAGLCLHVLHHQSVITFFGNTFSDNVSGPIPSGYTMQLYGGGLELYSDGGTLTFTNNQFLNNKNLDPNGLGGGLCIDNFLSGTLQMEGNVFVGNQNAGVGGGALINLGSNVTSAYIADNLFVNNQAGFGESNGSGGGLSIGSEVNVTLVNNTFYNNSADSAGGLGFYAESASDKAILANEIYWGNAPNSLEATGSGPIQATYSNIQDGTGQPYFGTGCIDSDPLFFNVANPPGADRIYKTIDDGLHLTATSPSFNTGANSAVPDWLTLDIAGQPRIQGNTVDMGAYEGVAGTPTTYTVTMEVFPETGGTTNPSVGSHELVSPQTITATANAGFFFQIWEVVEGNATLENANSASTKLTFSSNCRIRASFATVPATATLTMAVSPAEGGTTNPPIGDHTVDTQVEFTITATPAEGYVFTGWTKSGQVTLGNASAATTTAILLGNATITANFIIPPTTVNLMFIHHSCGQNWLDQGLRAALDAKEYIDEVNEITYNDVVANDTGRPASLGTVAGDSTDINTWLYWFNDYLDSIKTYGCESGTNRIIMFKSCFPNSHIESEGSGNGDPFSGDRTIVNYQAVFRNAAGAGTPYTNNGYNYLALEDVFAANPETLFIYVTAPPECFAEASSAPAKNARRFNDWLKQVWLPAYNTAHPGLNNVQVFDWFDVLANANNGAQYANMLKQEYGGSSGDSHPNEVANQRSTVIYATGTPNFIDSVFARFTGTAPQFAITMASFPAEGGITIPESGIANQYTPLVLTAIAAEGYTFTGWTISANGVVYNTLSPVTTLLASGLVNATANFAIARYMTLGSLETYTVADIEDFPGASFAKKPSMSANFTDPVSNNAKKAGLKTTFNSAQNTQFTAEWTKKQAIFNKKSIPQGTDSRTFIGKGLDPLLCYETEVKATANTGQKGTYNAGTLFIPAPEITAVWNNSQQPIPEPVTVSPGATIYLVGNFFGCSMPNVWFEYESNGRIKQVKCKILKDLISNSQDYLDAKNKPSCMNCKTGASRVPVKIPAAIKIPQGGFLPFIVIDNGVGRATFDLTVH
ncbi:MAG: choice-of-anchor Q domain-containing protein, partial [Candidatus Nanoarchaeia archaeon]